MPGGRPSKLTPAVQKRLCDAIRTGNYLAAACKFARIDYSTFTLWMNAGREATEGEFFEFFNAVELAKAEAEIRVVAEWQKHMPESYQACRDFLARRFPKRWGPKDKHEVSGPGGKPLEAKVEHSGEVKGPDEGNHIGSILEGLAELGLLPPRPVSEGDDTAAQ